jgi:predicted nuclease of predicted toxin-antitoxin system
MLRFFADQNFDGDIVRGLLRAIPDLDLLTAHQAGLSEALDPELLEWAAGHERVVLTHDSA